MSEDEDPAAGSGHPIVFGAVWLGQLVSVIGTSLTTFALGLWVYQLHGSVTDFALIGFCAVTPRVVLSPVAGAVVDRIGRRKVMLASSMGGGAVIVVVMALAWTRELTVWQVYAVAAISGALATFEWPAWSAATSVLVPRRHLGRASGLVSMAQAASGILGPILAATLLVVAGIEVVLIVDFVSFMFAATTLAVVRFPEPAIGASIGLRFRDELLSGLRHIRGEPALSRLVLFLMSVTFQWGIVAALIAPMVLGLGSAIELGQVLSAAGLGALAGAAFMGISGGPRRRVRGLVMAEAASGVAFLAMGVSTSVAFVALAAFAAHVTIPVIVGCDQVIWQERVPLALQGRVFAARQMIERLPAPLAYAVAGPLAERVFNPALAQGGPVGATLGPIFGTGGVRGIGLFFAVMGGVQLAIAASGFASVRLRELDEPASVVGMATGAHE
jgi:MFS family permease